MKQITLGIVGGGQLGRMLSESAKKLKVKTIILDPTPMSPAAQVADEQIVGDFKNQAKVLELAKKADYLTFETESANWQAMAKLEKKGIKVEPASKTLEIIQDKLAQKQFLLANNLPCAQFTQVKNAADIKKTASYLGYPLILKARFHAFDGRGNSPIMSPAAINKALQKLKGQKLYVEKYIPFKKELAIQVARSKDGKLKAFPLVETIQKNSICHIVKYPARVPAKVEKEARELALKTTSVLFGAGVFAIEMFLTSEGKVIINEIAPRVHNSGHWTIEGCSVSQFEQHIRAVCSLPLKNIKPTTKSAVMINILGTRNAKAKTTGIEDADKIDGANVHIYGKFETRKERKMGHITTIGDNLGSNLIKAQLARSYINI